MNLEKILKSGNEVRVRNESYSFITAVDEVAGENTFTVLVPSDYASRLNVKEGDTFAVSCVTERGIYMFETLTVDFDGSDKIPVITLKVAGNCSRVQRRQAYRVREKLQVSVCKVGLGDEAEREWVRTETVDIAELGTLLRFNEECPIGQKLEIILRINLFGMSEVLTGIQGTVVRCIPIRRKDFGYLLGVRFDDLQEKTRSTLFRLVVLSQRSKLSYKNAKHDK